MLINPREIANFLANWIKNQFHRHNCRNSIMPTYIIKPREAFLIAAVYAASLCNGQHFYPHHLAIAKSQGKRPMNPKAPKKKRGK